MLPSLTGQAGCVFHHSHVCFSLVMSLAVISPVTCSKLVSRFWWIFLINLLYSKPFGATSDPWQTVCANYSHQKQRSGLIKLLTRTVAYLVETCPSSF